MSKYWILKDKKIVKVDDVLTWGRWFETSKDRIVAKEYVGPYHVSTVFLGIDHSFGGKKPLLFETMIFGGEFDENEYQERYSTYRQAEKGHKKALELATKKYMDHLEEKFNPSQKKENPDTS
jgi:hypothetical protein